MFIETLHQGLHFREGFLEFRASFALIMDVIKEQTANAEKVLFAVESVAVQDDTSKETGI